MATSRQQSGSTPRKSPQSSRQTSAPSSRKRSTSRANGGSARAGNGSRSTSAKRASKPSATRSAPSQPSADTGSSTISKIAKPVIAGGAAVAAIVGGAVLGAKALPRKRRFPANIGHQLNGLGKSLDMKKARKQIEDLDINKARKQVGRASKQFGELTREIRKAGEKAERIGDALS